jgi:hypothetical protein
MLLLPWPPVPIKATRGNEFWAERTIGAANAAVTLAAPRIKASRRLWKRFMGNLMNPARFMEE